MKKAASYFSIRILVRMSLAQKKMSYDEYLDVQLASLGHAYRSGFANGIFNYLLEFKGQIEKVKPKSYLLQADFH